MYTYKLKDGEENRFFVGAKKNEDGTISSEQPIESPYVEAVSAAAAPSAAHVTGVAPQNQQGVAPTSPAPAPTQPVQPSVKTEQNTNGVA